MANAEHLAILRQGPQSWNRWRHEVPHIVPDLSMADLSSANLSGVNLHNADLSGADLSGADLTRARLVNTNLERANLAGCHVYGLSVWDVRLAGANQSDLVITQSDDSTITVDSLEVAQVTYLLLSNVKIRNIIDTVSAKIVLIFGAFGRERAAMREALRDGLRQHGYVPILLDVTEPAMRRVTEAVVMLAHLSRFIIVDFTDARGVPQELQHVVSALPSVPVQPIVARAGDEDTMFGQLRRYPWVLELYRYSDVEELVSVLPERVIAPAEARLRELRSP